MTAEPAATAGNEGPTAPASRLWVGLALVAILLLAFGLRLQGITYGLPNSFAPDETSKVETVKAFFRGEFNHAAHQPSFMFNTLYLIYLAAEPFRGAILHGLGLETGATPDQQQFAFYVWLGRLWMVVLSVGTVAAIFALGRRVAGNAAGLVAALLFAVLPLSISLSHYIKEDTPLGFWVTISLLAALPIIDRGRARDYMVAGVCCGCAFGAKYPGGLVAVAPILAHFLCVPELRAASRRRNIEMGLVPCGFALGFLTTSPAIFVHWTRVFRGVKKQVAYMQGGHHDGISIGPMEHWFTFYLTHALVPTLTLAVVLVGAVGLVFLIRRHRAPGIVLAAWALGYYLLTEAMPAKPYPFFARYMIPVVPPLCVGAGALVAEALRRGLRGTVAVKIGAAALAILVIGAPLASTVRFLRHVYPDTRTEGAEWLRQQPGARTGGVILAPNVTVLRQYTPAVTGTAWKMVEMMPDAIARAEAEARDGATTPTLAIISSPVVDRYFENPTDVPETTAMVRSVTDRWQRIARFRNLKGQAGFHNPTLAIYRPPGS